MFKPTRDHRIKKSSSGTYWAMFSRNGQRVRQSLFTKNFEIAAAQVNKIEQKILLGEDWTKLFERSKDDALISDLWPLFMKDKTEGTRLTKKARHKTLKGYEGFYRRYYSRFFGSLRIEDITQDVWDKYILAIKEECGEETKFLNHWKCLAAFTTWARKTKRMTSEPEIYNPDEDPDESVGKNYSDEELSLFREHSTGSFHLCIMMAQYHGMRSGEITQLRKDRIDLSTHMISLKKSDTKTKTARKFKVHALVWPLLKAQMDAHKDSPYVFPNRVDVSRPMDTTGFKKPWNALREKLGIDGRFHDFRHSYATRAFANPNINPVVLCESLGMSYKVARKHYIHFDLSHLSAVADSFELNTCHKIDIRPEISTTEKTAND